MFGICLQKRYLSSTDDGNYVITKLKPGTQGQTLSSNDLFIGDYLTEINGFLVTPSYDADAKRILSSALEDGSEEIEITVMSVDGNRIPNVIENCDSATRQITGDVPTTKAYEDDLMVRSTSNKTRLYSTGRRMNVSFGQVEIQISYDYTAEIFYVTILRARNIKNLKSSDPQPDAFIMGYLVPTKSICSMRKTRYVLSSSTPCWNQTFVYPNVTLGYLKTKFLEITAWSYNRHEPNEFLGEVVLDLSESSLLDEKITWYQLRDISQSGLDNGSTKVSSIHRDKSAKFGVSNANSKNYDLRPPRRNVMIST